MRSLLQSFLALVCLYSAVEALPQVGTPSELTNGERMARGLRPLKPARLFDASVPNVLRPRSSAAPGAQTFQVAAGPASSQGTRKRDEGVPGYFALNGDSLSFVSAQANAATLYYTNPSTSVGLSVVTPGAPAEIYAVLSGSVYIVKVGTPPAGSKTSILARSRYTGDLTPSLPPAGSTTSQDALWVRGGSGVLFIAFDSASAVAYDPSATVLLVQTFRSGQPASLAAASAAQQNSLANPVKFYVRDVPGRIRGYFWFVPSSTPMLVYQNSKDVGYTFYSPNFGKPASDQRALTTLSGTTVVGAFVANSQGSYLKFVDASTNTSPILSFNIPASGSGKVSLSSGGTSLNGLFWANGGNNDDTFRFIPCPSTDPSSCESSLPNIQPLCLEAVMGNVDASVCVGEAIQKISMDYTGRSSVYVYDPAGVYTGYVSFSEIYQSVSLVATPGAATYVYSRNPVTSRRSLWTIKNKDTDPYVSGFEASQGGSGGKTGYRGIYSTNTGGGNAVFNIPGPGAEMTLYQETSSLPDGVTLQDWPFYWTGPSGGIDGYLSSCPSATYCPADRGYVRVCTELVPDGGSPQLCKAGWQVPS